MNPKKSLYGPSGWRITLDSRQVYPDDPGNGTPAMVYGPKHGPRCDQSSTFNCALGEGECSSNGDEIPPHVMSWLHKQVEPVNDWLADAEEKFRKLQEKYLPPPCEEPEPDPEVLRREAKFDAELKITEILK